MVELLKRTIEKICGDIGVKEYLETKYQSKTLSKLAEDDIDWIDKTSKYITNSVRGRLEWIKHHENFKYKNVVESAMNAAEGMLIVLLE